MTDEKELEKLFKQHYRQMYRLATILLHDDAESKDVVHDFLLNSRSFVGSITTGPSVFIMKLRVDDPHMQAVDCPQDRLASSLSQTIDARATIS
jgi:hypothetical protein